MTFVLRVDGKDITVTCCGDCPRNITSKNKLFPIFPVHHCKDTPDPVYREGKLVFNPMKIPAWCPHVAP